MKKFKIFKMNLKKNRSAVIRIQIKSYHKLINKLTNINNQVKNILKNSYQCKKIDKTFYLKNYYK